MNIGLGNTLVLGASGQLGSAFKSAWGTPAHVRYCGREEVDVLDYDALETILTTCAPAVVVNCTGYTAVDKAESEPDAAHALNAEAPERIARLCKQVGATLVHFSTDYVFGGPHPGRAYRETDTPAPTSVYGRTKLEGESRVLATGCSCWILRVSWLYSQFGKNFLLTMERLAQEHGRLCVVNDQVASPTWAGDVVWAVTQLLQNGGTPAGLVHFTNRGVASWYDFATEIVRQRGWEVPVEPVPTTTFSTPAQRPVFSKLDTTTFFHTVWRQPNHWRSALTNCNAGRFVTPRPTEPRNTKGS